MMPGTDVDFLFNQIFGQLKAGVIIHIHDIFLPDDYPQSWEWRGYNEQLGVAALLQGQGYDVLFPVIMSPSIWERLYKEH